MNFLIIISVIYPDIYTTNYVLIKRSFLCLFFTVGSYRVEIYMPKMKILNSSEQNIFDSPPVFNSVERKRFISLPLTLNESMENLKTPTNKVCFLATAGYFKARHRFFARQFNQVDIEYIAKKIGVDPNDVQPNAYDKGTQN